MSATMKAKNFCLLGGLVLAAGIFIILRWGASGENTEGRNLLPAQSLALGSAEGFARVLEPREFDFPQDHGPHEEYQTEWWYYTGNLTAAGGQRFGYQLTFFRRALLPPGERLERTSAWAADQVYFAHFALSDISNDQFHAFERFSRGAAGLAGAAGAPLFSVWLDNWQVEQIDSRTYRLRAAQNGISLELELRDEKGPVLQGENGFSQKGPEPGNASFYISLSRLATSGTVRAGDAAFTVEGLSWMDHEFGTSALGKDQVGWDWFALQLDDGSELMLFTLRREDGSIDPYSGATLIAADGNSRWLSSADFEIEVEDHWTSPQSGARYPAGWTVRIPTEEIELKVDPVMADQELRLIFNYWEGAVRVSGTKGGRPAAGVGYAELTGYAGSMQGQF